MNNLTIHIKIHNLMNELHDLKGEYNEENTQKRTDIRLKIAKLKLMPDYKRLQHQKRGRVVRILPDTWKIIRTRIRSDESISMAIHRFISAGLGR